MKITNLRIVSVLRKTYSYTIENGHKAGSFPTIEGDPALVASTCLGKSSCMIHSP
jgi:hypothetical protein